MNTITITINGENANITFDVSSELSESELRSRIEQVASPDWLIEAWHISDVQDASDGELDDEQCREVLRRAKHSHDANIGINWDVLQYHADVVAEECGITE